MMESLDAAGVAPSTPDGLNLENTYNTNIPKNERNHNTLIYGTLGPELSKRGFPVIPVNGKKPLINNWNKHPPTEAEVDTWAKIHPEANIGLLCGFYDIICIDVDIYDTEMAESIRNIFGRLHSCPVVVGQGPKFKILVRCPGLTRKLTSASYDHIATPPAKGEKRKISRIEILCQGQQAVIAGIHPDTNQPYTGLDYDGFSLINLLTIFADEVFWLLDLFESKAEKAGWRRVADRPAGSRGPNTDAEKGVQQNFTDKLAEAQPEPAGVKTSSTWQPEPIEKLRSALFSIDPDQPYDVWLSLIMVIHASTIGSPQGLALAVEWSAGGAKYIPGDVEKRWAGFRLDGGISSGTLYKFASDDGWHWVDDPLVDFADLQVTVKKPRRSRLRLTPVSVLLAEAVKPVDWVVRKLIPSGAVVMFYGESGVGKSTFIMDVGLSVASGQPWHGHQVQHQGILYLCGEGHRGVTNRIRAWCTHHECLPDIPFFVSDRAVPILDLQAMQILVQEIDAAEEHHGVTIGFIIIDTLARSVGDGDENSTKDMSAFVQNIDKFLAGRTVAIVHHTGLADKNRARGSSVLRGAVDAEYQITRRTDGLVELYCKKAKDFEQWQNPLLFKPSRVVIGATEDEGLIESLVFGKVDMPTAILPELSKERSRALEILKELIDSSPNEFASREAWRDQCIAAGLYSSNGSFNNTTSQLQKNGLIRSDGQRVWLVRRDDG